MRIPFLLGFWLISLFSAQASATVAKPNLVSFCEARFSTTSVSPSKGLFPRITAHFHELLERDSNLAIDASFEDPRIADLTEELLAASSPSAREMRIRLQQDWMDLKNHERLPFDLREAIGLALYDTQAWDRFIMRSWNTNNFRKLKWVSVIRSLEEMPSNFRAWHLKRIGHYYPYAQKIGSDLQRGISQKRGLDKLLKHVLRGDQLITEEIAAGTPPLLAYDDYLSRVAETLNRPIEQRYRAEDIVRAARAMQAELRKLDLPPEENKLALLGSFPNGKSKLETSDYDVVAAHWKIAQILPSIKDAANRALGPEAKMAIDNHVRHSDRFTPEEWVGYWAEYETAIVNITTTRIELLVYPTIYEGRKIPEPARYLLEGNP